MYFNYSRASQVGDGGGGIGLISTIDMLSISNIFLQFSPCDAIVLTIG